MIEKRPQSSFIRSVRNATATVLVIEGVLLLGSYVLWRRMNTSQDFRYYMYRNWPFLLEGYYTIGEKLSGYDHLRKFDHKTWMEKRDEQ
ncbi:hypothetical protein P5V15_012196 [Pogonomyrmex californicus]